MTTANATFDNVHNINEKEAAGKFGKKMEDRAAKAREKKITWFGAAWRITSMVLLIVAAVTAVCLGMNFAIAYVAGLGLSSLVTTLLSMLITAVAYISSAWLGYVAGQEIGWVLYARQCTKAAEQAAKDSK